MYPIWLITDTHFEHRAMIEFCGRPTDFTRRIVRAWQRDIKPDDLVIHLGDIGNAGRTPRPEVTVQPDINIAELPGRKVLVRGNHDKASYSWYLSHGWHCVCESMSIQAYGKRLLFSHKPQPFRNDWDLNIHGHFHNCDFRKHEPQLAAILTPQHLLYALEYDGYAPQLLRTFLHKRKII